MVKLVTLNGKFGPWLPRLVFTGPVDTMTSGPVNIDGSTAKAFTFTFMTPAGNLAIQHIGKTIGSQPAWTRKGSSTCYFTNTATGSYAVAGSRSTAKFAGATGTGTGTMSIVEGANLLPGKTTCDISNLSGMIADQERSSLAAQAAEAAADPERSLRVTAIGG